MNFAAVVLAAGKSSRMGNDKLSMPLYTADVNKAECSVHNRSDELAEDSCNTTFCTVGEQVLRTVLQVEQFHSIVVVQAPYSSVAWQQISERYRTDNQPRMNIVCCQQAEQGMSYSLRYGFNQLCELAPAIDAAMIVLGDQPLLELQHLQSIIIKWTQIPGLDYLTACDGEIDQPPVLIHRRVWHQLEQLTGDQGARKMLATGKWRGERIELPEYCFWDSDTPVQLQHIQDYLKHLDK